MDYGVALNLGFKLNRRIILKIDNKFNNNKSVFLNLPIVTSNCHLYWHWLRMTTWTFTVPMKIFSTTNM